VNAPRACGLWDREALRCKLEAETMQMYYFFVFAILIFAAPVVFGRRLDDRPAAAVDGRAGQRSGRKDEGKE
jgi:hypothetical protein